MAGEALITAVIDTNEREHAWQARAAAVAAALQQNLRLVGSPTVKADMLGGRRRYVYTWETAPL